MGPTLGPRGSHTAPTWVHMGSRCGPTRVHVGPRRSHVGPTWVPRGSHVGPRGSHVGPTWVSRGSQTCPGIIACHCVGPTPRLGFKILKGHRSREPSTAALICHAHLQHCSMDTCPNGAGKGVCFPLAKLQGTVSRASLEPAEEQVSRDSHNVLAGYLQFPLFAVELAAAPTKNGQFQRRRWFANPSRSCNAGPVGPLLPCPNKQLGLGIRFLPLTKT